MGNDLVNFSSTLFAAVLAAVVYRFFVYEGSDQSSEIRASPDSLGSDDRPSRVRKVLH